jgi:hypothetical protein
VQSDKGERMVDQNFQAEWHPVGQLSKFKKDGVSNGNRWLRCSMRYYNGKSRDKELRFIDVGFFVPQDQIDEMDALLPNTKIRLHGWPEWETYENKEGKTVVSAACRLDRNQKIEIVAQPKSATPEVEDYSDEPF